MRGQVDPQSGLFSYFSVEERIPADHPLRRIKARADSVLRAMNAEFEAMYAEGGRPSIAPKRLLKASLLIALYSVRSERLFCEMRSARVGLAKTQFAAYLVGAAYNLLRMSRMQAATG